MAPNVRGTRVLSGKPTMINTSIEGVHITSTHILIDECKNLPVRRKPWFYMADSIVLRQKTRLFPLRPQFLHFPFSLFWHPVFPFPTILHDKGIS